MLPAGHKKAPKIYAIACHPLQPHIVAVGANAGTCCLPAVAECSAMDLGYGISANAAES